MKKLILLGAIMLSGCSSYTHVTDDNLREAANIWSISDMCDNKLSNNSKEAPFKMEFQKLKQVTTNFVGYHFSPEDKQKLNNLISQFLQTFAQAELKKSDCIKLAPRAMQYRMQANNNLMRNHQYHLIVQ